MRTASRPSATSRRLSRCRASSSSAVTLFSPDRWQYHITELSREISRHIRLPIKLMKIRLNSNQALYLIIFLGLITRILYLIYLPNELVNPDDTDYWSCSENIIRGNGFSLQPTDDRLAHIPPGYPLFLACLKMMGITSLFYIRLVQTILSISVIPAIYYLGADIFSRKVMILTGLLYALSPQLIHWSTQILTENLAVILFTVSFFAYIKGLIENDMKFQYGSIVLLGFAALTRSVFLFVLPVFLLGIVIRSKEWLKKTSILLSLFILILLPWTIRNYMIFKHFVPVTLGTGYIQVHQLEHYSDIYRDVLDQNYSFYKHHEYHYVHPETPIEEYTSDNALRTLAMEMMKTHPLTTIRFFVRNFLRFWTPGVTFYSEKVIYRQFFPSFVFSGLLYPFVIIGLIRFYRANKTILVITLLIFLCFSLVHSFLIAMLRFRAPLEPVLYLFCSIGLFHLWDRSKVHTRKCR